MGITNEESEVTWIKPVIPKNMGSLFPKQRKCNRYREQSKGSGANLANDCVNTNPDGDRMARFRDPTKKCHGHSYRSFFFFLVSSCPGLFLGIASNSTPGLRWKMIKEFLNFSDKGTNEP